ncbi:MAG: hypothetical protein K1X78_07200 [Verrucomicrobiaceae bacterium]|nr:hypothetical protein [Verrucomicrobiaceae bacterium]
MLKNRPSGNPEPADGEQAVKTGGSQRSMWQMGVALVVFSLIVAGIFGGRAVWRKGMNMWGGHIAAQVADLMKDEKWDSAARAVGEALRTAPEDPAVLRVAAEYLQKTNGDPEMARYFLQRLQDLNAATAEDSIRLGEALIITGDVSRARKVYAELPTAEKQKRKGMELLAKILDDEGQKPLAMSTLRQALLTEPDNPESILRLAMLDLDQPFNETRRQAQDMIWTLALKTDDTALQAVSFLAASKDLTAGEADDLVKTVNAHPKAKDNHRFAVLSAYMRLFPTRRDEVLDAECTKYKGKDIDALVHLLRWLTQERQPDRILSLVPKSLVLKSADAFPAYAEALLATGKYADLKAVIQGNPPPPLSQANAHAYLAACFSKLEPDLLQAKQEIDNAYRAAAKSGEHGVILRAAELAETHGLWDLAAKGYEAIAAKNARVRVAMLTKVYEMASLAKDGGKMLDIAARISASRPDSWAFKARADYLRMVIGSGFEAACESVLTMDAAASAETRSPESASYLAVLRALALYRLGDRARIKTELSAVAAPESLPPGLRAVLAGLTKLSLGDAAAAYRIAEAVPPTILLKEEVRFLNMAL